MTKTNPSFPYCLAITLSIIVISLIAFKSVQPLLNKGKYAVMRQFNQIPVLMNGRIKPLDTVARNSLMIISGKQIIKNKENGTFIKAQEWIMNVLMNPSVSDNQPIFLIHHPDIKLMIGGDDKQKYYRFNDLLPFEETIRDQAAAARETDASARTSAQRAFVHLHDSMILYYRLKNSLASEGSTSFLRELSVLSRIIQSDNQIFNTDQEHASAFHQYGQYFQFINQTALLRFIPTDNNKDWKTTGQSVIDAMGSGSIDPLVTDLARMRAHHQQKDRRALSTSLKDYFDELKKRDVILKKVSWEQYFNEIAPFRQAMVLYVFALIAILISWFSLSPAWRISALIFMSVAFLWHTGGLGTRLYLQGRPPVTNLYSSAVFIGWSAVGSCFVLEKFFRRGIAVAIAACIGFSTLLIAHHLSGDGDTMEMMQAVLDSNFWLATHVVIITLGYSATFVAGFTGIIFILRGLFTRSLDKQDVSHMNMMVYGTICFALLFSFVGTILGGIWADQSWGRFWGWDPKENGALMIVIWNATILHARLAGMIRTRGLMICSVIGNIITAFSWFGVNLLGVGLHSYGFLDKTFKGLVFFITSQLMVIVVALTPYHRWKSFSVENKIKNPKNDQKQLTAIDIPLSKRRNYA